MAAAELLYTESSRKILLCRKYDGKMSKNLMDKAAAIR